MSFRPNERNTAVVSQNAAHSQQLPSPFNHVATIKLKHVVDQKGFMNGVFPKLIKITKKMIDTIWCTKLLHRNRSHTRQWKQTEAEEIKRINTVSNIIRNGVGSAGWIALSETQTPSLLMHLQNELQQMQKQQKKKQTKNTATNKYVIENWTINKTFGSMFLTSTWNLACGFCWLFISCSVLLIHCRNEIGAVANFSTSFLIYFFVVSNSDCTNLPVLFKLKLHFFLHFAFEFGVVNFYSFISNNHQIHNWTFGQCFVFTWLYTNTHTHTVAACMLLPQSVCAMNALIFVVRNYGVWRQSDIHTGCQYWQISPQALFFLFVLFRRFRCWIYEENFHMRARA